MSAVIQDETPQAVTEERPGLMSRIAGVLLSPGRTFAAIVARPDWLAPLLITAIVVGAVSYVLYKPVIIPMQLEQMRNREPPIPADQLALMQTRMESPVAGVFAAIMPAIFTFVIVLVQAGLLFFIGALVLGGQSTFKKVFAVCAYTSIVYALSTLLQAPVHLWATHTMDPVAGLGFLIPSDAPSFGLRFVRGLLSSIDLFVLWATAILAIGVAKAFNRPTSFGATCAVILWAVSAILLALVSAVSPRA
jgi:hypothetical protein